MFTRVAEWPNALVCKTSQPRVRIPPRVLMKETMNTPTKIIGVEAAKTASLWCKELFPHQCIPPFQGELQNVIRFGWEAKADEETIKNAGNWWLWMRNIFIENTITRPMKDKLMRMATSGQPITLITTRSPELLHTRIGKGDPTLPRSRKSLLSLKNLVDQSAKFVPTHSLVMLADLSIDNEDKIKKVCDIESVILENIQKITDLSRDIGLESKILRMSEHVLLQSITQIPPHAWSHVKKAMFESLDSHRREFGWTLEQSESHNLSLAITMGSVGLAFNHGTNVLIHNESFISRGALNNIFNPTDNPIPVICLRDLVKKGRSKI